jgi:hypothetical protein
VDEDGSTANRLWRLEQRQNDVLTRLEKIELLLELVRHAGEARTWRIDEIDRHIEALEKKPTGMFGENRTAQLIIYGLVAAVVALAGGSTVLTKFLP